MPSHKPVRTYQKKTRLNVNSSSKSVEAINALFAENLTKRLKSRKKTKLKVKELPPRTEAYVTDDSLVVDPENTFDKLLKGEVYNEVKVGNVGRIPSSDSEASKNRTQVSVTIHSPIMTRKRTKCSVAIEEVESNSNSYARVKSLTVDKITNSLCIEKENKKVSPTSLDYITLPKITENEVMNNNMIFSDTFREKALVHSSTPCHKACVKIVADPISPIIKSDSPNTSHLIEKSYDQIRKWSEKFPNLENETSARGRRKKKSEEDEDWKLSCQPKVYLKTSDLINGRKSKGRKLKKSEDCEDFKGYNEEEVLSFRKLSNELKSFVDDSCKEVNKMTDDSVNKFLKMKNRNSKVTKRIGNLRKGRRWTRRIENRDEDSKSRISQNEDSKSRISQNEDSKSRIPPHKVDEEKHTPEESFKISRKMRTRSEDLKSRISKRSLETPKSLKIETQNEDSKSRPSKVEDSQISQREDPNSRISKNKDPPISQNEDPPISQNEDSKSRISTHKDNEEKTLDPPKEESFKVLEKMRTRSEDPKSRLSKVEDSGGSRISKREGSNFRISKNEDSEDAQISQCEDSNSRISKNEDSPISKREDSNSRVKPGVSRIPKRQKIDAMKNDEAPKMKISPKSLKRFQSVKVLVTPLKKSTKKRKIGRPAKRLTNKTSQRMTPVESLKKKNKTPLKRIRGPLKSINLLKKSRLNASTHKSKTPQRRFNLRSRSTKTKEEEEEEKKKSLYVNVTEDILSEKELSYSDLSSSFDFSPSHSPAKKKTYTPEELNEEREITSPKNRTVNLQDFDSFMKNYYDGETEKKNEEIRNEVLRISIISLSDESGNEESRKFLQVKPMEETEVKEDTLASLKEGEKKETILDLITPIKSNPTSDPKRSCLNLIAPFQSNPTSDPKRSCLNLIAPIQSNPTSDPKRSCLNLITPIKSNPTSDPERSSLSLITPIKNITTDPRRSSQSPKIIILSNVSLGFSKAMIERNASLNNITHDHSYSSPASKVLTVPVEKVQTSSLTRTPLSDIMESSYIDKATLPPPTPRNQDEGKRFFKKSIKLKPGKSYRRSLSLLRRSSVLVDVQDSRMCHNDCVCLKCLFRSRLNPEISRRSSLIVPVSKNSLSKSILESYARSSACYVQEEDHRLDNLDESVRNISLSEVRKSLDTAKTAKELVLRRCGQTEVLPFEECYPRSTLQHCQKIGEGVYGEVFLYRSQDGGTSVMKVIPIEGDLIVNDERQKKFDEILTEIVIAMELSNLKTNKKNTTSSFSEVKKARCTQGCYPDRLLDLWDLYDETKGSENDSPQMFPSNQMYIVLELANGGKDLESYVFNNAMQAFAMFKQTACALAVAELQLKFEHRDLHWGNILLTDVDKEKTLFFRLDGKEIDVETYGVEVSIIDFTLSRIEYDGVVIFNNLSLDKELFVAHGDYQFDIYREMQKRNRNKWQHFEPYSNVLWLHYLLDKAVSSALRYKNPRTKVHKEFLGKLKKMKDEILTYNSVMEFVTDKFL